MSAIIVELFLNVNSSNGPNLRDDPEKFTIICVIPNTALAYIGMRKTNKAITIQSITDEHTIF